MSNSSNIIWQNELVYIEVEASDNPWLKIFVKRKVKEFSSCTMDEKTQIWQILDIIEKSMLDYYKPEKINIASFGNIVPQVHFHIIARFKNDACFPNPIWGKRQRECSMILPKFDIFIVKIVQILSDNTL